MANTISPKDVIACRVEMFSENMPVFVVKGGVIQNASIPGENAANILVDLCHQQDIYNLKLDGNAEYMQVFLASIKEAERKNYAHADHSINIITQVTALNAAAEGKPSIEDEEVKAEEEE